MKSLPVCKSHFESLPNEVRDEFGLTKQNFSKEDLIISVENSGIKAPQDFNRVYCQFCETEVLPNILEKFKEQLGEKSTIIDLISKWDCLPSPKDDSLVKYVDVLGCFIPNPPNDEKTCPGPNYRKFLLRPTEHVKSSHPHTQENKSKASSSTKQKGGLAQLLFQSQTPKKVLVLDATQEIEVSSNNDPRCRYKFQV